MVDGDWRPEFQREKERETNGGVEGRLDWSSGGEESKEREVAMSKGQAGSKCDCVSECVIREEWRAGKS